METFKKILNYVWEFIKYLVGATIGLISAILQVFSGFLATLTLILIIGGIVGCLIYNKVRPDFEEARAQAYDKLSSVDGNTFSMLSDTEVYDKDNNLIGLISAGHYEYVSIDKISDYIQNGYVAVEDKRFKQHIGIDYVSILRAFVSLVKHNGEIHQGGSTIDQQVVKNCLLTQEKTFSRKMTEIMIAPYIDNRFGKDKVMEFYCNTNYYGHRCYGVQAASRYYFGKDAKDLEVWEAALLCRISNSPSNYDPVKHPKDAIEGRNFVLKEMFNMGFIDEDTYKNAKEQPLAIVQEYAEGTNENYQTSFAIYCTALELMKNDGFEFKYTFSNKDDYDKYREAYDKLYSEKSEEIRSGGYVIHTTLDSDIQNDVQNRLSSVLDKFKDRDEKTGKYTLQGAAVVVNNQTNNVVAIVGGRETDDLFNRGYLAMRQPGSTIKPLIDYTPAFDTGLYSPSSVLNDHEFEGGPSNSGGGYRGLITLREALNRSLNTIAWQLLQSVGVNNGLEYLGNMKFSSITYVDNDVPALSIGGFTRGVRVVDMAKGYSTLANCGIYNDKTCLTSIKYKDKEVFKNKEKEVRVYGEDAAYMITDVLKGTMDKEYGTGYGLDINGQEAAGKTGTTNDNKDAWFCGYTRYYTTAVWMGYDTPKKMPGVYGATYAGKIWQDIMTDLHEGLETWDWEMPDTVYNCPYDPSTGAEVDYDTGLVDLFSSTAKERAEEALELKKDEEAYNKAKAYVEAYEAWYINNIEDAKSVTEHYNEVLKYVSLINNSEKRTELNKRVAEHKNKIDESLKDWQEAIEEYNRAEEESIAESKANAEKEAEEKAKQAFKEAKIARVNNIISDIQKSEFKDAQAYKRFTGQLETALKECEEFVEYFELEERAESAISAYSELPNYSDWKASKQAEAEAEESLAYEDRLRKEEAARNLHENIESNEVDSSEIVNESTEFGPVAY